jgi:hypothetical protein
LLQHLGFSHPGLQFRRFQGYLDLNHTPPVFEGLQERGALIVVPSSAVETMNLGGIAGLTALAQNVQNMIPKTDSDSPSPEDQK